MADNQEETVVEESKGFSIASMVLGILSVVFFCLWYLSIPCSILAIIFGVIGMKKGGKGMATAGLVLGIIAIAIVAILLITGVSIISSLV